MRAAVISNGTFRVDDVADPEPGDGELVLRVAATGICGSDLSTAPFLPDGRIMGHEFAGEVVATGPGLTDWLGAPVASMPVIGCRACRACLVGDVARCPAARTLGLGVLAGSLAEFVLVGAAESVRLDRLPGAREVTGNDAGLGDAALTEPLAVGLHAVTRASIAPGDRVLVIGAGPVGLAALAWLSRSSAGEIVCSDPVPERLVAATDLGATSTTTPDAVSASEPFDVVIECVGKPGIVATALECVAPGGRIVVAGVCLTPDEFMPVAAVVKEVSMHFVSYYTKAEFVTAATSVMNGSIDPGLLVSRTAGLDDLTEIFATLSAPNKERKVLIRP